MKNIALMLIILLAAPAYAGEVMRQITVVGHGQVKSVPDMATVSMGVISHAKTAAGVVQENAQSLSRVLGDLTTAGIAKRDIQTSSLTLSPRWNNRSSVSKNPPEITGFVATNTVTVRILDLGQLGVVLDGALQSGANNVQDLQFGMQNPEPLLNAARQDAVKDAISKAELYANAAGVKLGKVQLITEAPQGGRSPVMLAQRAMHDGAVPIARGEVEMASSVTVVFAIAE